MQPVCSLAGGLFFLICLASAVPVPTSQEADSVAPFLISVPSTRFKASAQGQKWRGPPSLSTPGDQLTFPDGEFSQPVAVPDLGGSRPGLGDSISSGTGINDLKKDTHVEQQHGFLSPPTEPTSNEAIMFLTGKPDAVHMTTEVEILRIDEGTSATSTVPKGSNPGTSSKDKDGEEIAKVTAVDTDTIQLIIKLVGMVLVVASSLLGVLPPILGFQTLMGTEGGEPPALFFHLRGFTAGILLSLAFVHIIADAFENLDGLTGEYPTASVLVL